MNEINDEKRKGREEMLRVSTLLGAQIIYLYSKMRGIYF